MKTFVTLIAAACVVSSAHAAELASQIAALGDQLGEVVIRETWDVKDNLTVPENVTLQFHPGGALNIAKEKTLTLQGGIEAGPFRIFSGAGSVAGSPKVRSILPEWFFDGKYNDETVDWSDAINQAIALATQGTRHVSLLNRRYNVRKVISLATTEPGSIANGRDRQSVTLEGAVRSTQFQLGTLLIGNTGTGNAAIETSNSDGIHLKNIGVIRGKTTPSDIGLLQARCEGTMWAGDQYHENVFVDMGSAVSVNNGFGTIGVVNIAGEETRWHNLQVWANLPLIISWSGGRSDDPLAQILRTNGDLKTSTKLEIKSSVGLQPVNGYSNTVFCLTGLGRLIAYDYVSPCVLINMGGMVDLGWTFMQKRESGANEAGFTVEGKGRHNYPVEIWNCFQYQHRGSIEGCKGYLLNRRGLYNADVTVTIAGGGEKSLPAILLLDDGTDDRLNYHTHLQDCRFSVFSFDEERPLIASRNLDGTDSPTRFVLRNCDLKTNQPFHNKSAPNTALLERTFGTAWFFSNGHIPVGSRDFVPEPGPAGVTTLKSNSHE